MAAIFLKSLTSPISRFPQAAVLDNQIVPIVNSAAERRFLLRFKNSKGGRTKRRNVLFAEKKIGGKDELD